MKTKKTATKKAATKKTVAKKAAAKTAAAVVVTPLQALQAKLDAAKGNDPWHEKLRARFNWCSVPACVSQRKSLADAWKNCERTDWMMTMLRSVKDERKGNGSYDRVLDEATRNRMQFEFDWMEEEFGKRFKSRHDGSASSIYSTHTGHSNKYKPWTSEERMQMTDFIRFYFPTPQPQKRKYAKQK